VPATDTAIDNTQIRDRRRWARGAFCRIVRNSNASAGNDYANATANLDYIDSTNLAPRIECSGAPLRVTLTGVLAGSAGQNVTISPQVDGAGVDGMPSIGAVPSSTKGLYHVFAEPVECLVFEWVIVPAAGSHVIAPAMGAAVAFVLRARATQPMVLQIEEMLRQNTANNSVTSG
jgi:hypothetical protein